MYLRRVNPDVVAARVNRHDGTKRWDLLLGLVFILPTMLAMPIVAALDDGRYHWSHLPWWGVGLGYALLITGFVGVTWAESVNKFFEPSVRIQTDRGHRVIDGGPYAVVRHPGYVSGFFVFYRDATLPRFFVGIDPRHPVVPALVVRTIWEDQTLRAELAGYDEYAQRVRYRLIPGVW